MWVRIINMTFCSRSLKSRDVAMVTDFGRESAKIGKTTLILCAATDGRIATWMRALTPPMILLQLIKIW